MLSLTRLLTDVLSDHVEFVNIARNEQNVEAIFGQLLSIGSANAISAASHNCSTHNMLSSYIG